MIVTFRRILKDFMVVLLITSNTGFDGCRVNSFTGERELSLLSIGEQIAISAA